MPDGSPLFTPRALKAELAAYYVGLSLTTFHQVVAPAVPAVQLTPGRKAWLREDLDAWLDSRRGTPVDGARPAGDAGAPEDPHDSASPVSAALAYAAAQGRAGRAHKARRRL